jgi:hypothetical protein
MRAAPLFLLPSGPPPSDADAAALLTPAPAAAAPAPPDLLLVLTVDLGEGKSARRAHAHAATRVGGARGACCRPHTAHVISPSSRARTPFSACTDLR